MGIDIIPPILPATGTTLDAPGQMSGLAVRVHPLSLGVALLIYGGYRDRAGRKSIVIFASLLVILTSMLACLSQFVVFRGFASVPAMAVYTIVQDVFEGRAALFDLNGSRIPYLVPVSRALLLLLAMPAFWESGNVDARDRLRPRSLVHGYLSVLPHPVCLGYMLVQCRRGGAGLQSVPEIGSASAGASSFRWRPQRLRAGPRSVVPRPLSPLDGAGVGLLLWTIIAGYRTPAERIASAV
ncbi:hypothetical protein AJ87_09250 [Rhizobium yanglingense]|nr:hypothetical protein AJ87_09250 [Rhizobium yanglingense]